MDQHNASTDSFTQAGAEAMATRIAEYWKRRGFVVKVWAEPATTGFTNVLRTGDYYVIRSDLVNGWPRR